MANVLKSPPRVDTARLQQREARAESTYRDFLKRLSGNGRMSEDFAERAAVAVVSALEQRLTHEEARQLDAQLPLRLTKLVCSGSMLIHVDARADKQAFLAAIGEQLGLAEGEVEPVVRAVFSTIREKISEGEAEDVAAQLPADLAVLWAEAA